MLEFLEVMTSFTISVNYDVIKASALIVLLGVVFIGFIDGMKHGGEYVSTKTIKTMKTILLAYIGFVIILHICAYAVNLNDYHEFMVFKRHLHEIVEMYK